MPGPFKFFPGGEDRFIAEDSLDYWTKEEYRLRIALEQTRAELRELQHRPPPEYSYTQLCLAKGQAQSDIKELEPQHKSALLKLEWEKKRKWKKK